MRTVPPNKLLAHIVCLCLAVLCLPKQAQAKTQCRDYVPPELRKNAEALTLQGVACFEAKQYGKALRHYRQAFTYAHTPFLEAAIGRSMHELGMWSAARAYYQRFLSSSTADTDPAGKRLIKKRLNALQKQLKKRGSTVSFKAHPTRTYVYLALPNGHRESLGATPMALKMAPGSYTFIFERRGYHASKEEITLDAASKHELDVELVPQNAPFNISARTYKQVGITTIACGIPILTAGGILWSIGANRVNEAETLIGEKMADQVSADDRALLDSGTSQASWGRGLFILGSAAVITGSVLTITGYAQESDAKNIEGKKRKRRASNFTPWIGWSQAGFTYQW